VCLDWAWDVEQLAAYGGSAIDFMQIDRRRVKLKRLQNNISSWEKYPCRYQYLASTSYLITKRSGSFHDPQVICVKVWAARLRG
jgi:hypothetical protein